MKKGPAILVAAVTISLSGMFMAACVQGDTTHTVTITAPPAGSSITQTVTVTRTVTVPEGTSGPLEPRPTPHSLSFGQGACFWCHPIPPGHEGRSAVQDLCAECHYEAPMSEWKIGYQY